MMPRHLALPLAGPALALITLAGAQAAEPISKTFRDWYAGCDNIGACKALSLPAETAETAALLRLERQAGPEAPASLAIRIHAEKLAKATTASITLDGATVPATVAQLPVSHPDPETAVVTIPGAGLDAFLAAARKATKLTATLGGRRFEISLSGSVAALLWIDEQQGRLDTATALVRKGDRPISAVPAAKPLPVVTAITTAGKPALPKPETERLVAGLRKAVQQAEPDLCEAPEDAASIPDQVYPLGDDRQLVALFCGLGAYNAVTGFWTVEGADPAKASKLVLQRPGETADNMLINAEYDPATGRLTFDAKGRGIGDCGSTGTYVWDGSRFVLGEFSTMDPCRGLPQEDWLTLVRHEIRQAK